jgi:hypothetical protein
MSIGNIIFTDRQTDRQTDQTDRVILPEFGVLQNCVIFNITLPCGFHGGVFVCKKAA